MANLAGRTALVTGGGSGIGLAVARLLLGAGANVAIAGRNAGKLEQGAQTLAGGDRVLTHTADVADPDQVNRMAAAVAARFGRVDILVNNAGTNIKERTFRELTPERWQQLIRTNLDGAFYCIQAVLPGMRERRDGVIVNISSVAGKRASPLGGVAYAASKFGMTALGIGLAAEEKDSGVRVANIYPGEVDTPILEVRPQPITEAHRQTILKPEDVAGAVLFVVSQPPHVSIPELIIKPTTHTYV